METPQHPWTTCASTRSPSQWENISWCSEGNSVCAHCLCSSHWASLKRAQFTLFAPSLQLFTYIDEIPLSLLFFRLSSPSSLSLPSNERCSSSITIFMVFSWKGQYIQYVHVSLVLMSPGQDPELQVRHVAGSFMFSLVSTRTHRAFFAKLHLSQVAPSRD